MMNRMSFSETIFLFLLALVIFGPKKLPEIARQVGKYLNEFRRASNEFKAQIEQEIAHLEVENKPTILPPRPPVQGTTSRTLSPSAAEVTYAEATVSTEVPPASSQATLAASAEDPVPAADNGATPPVATEAVQPADEVTSSASQESHV